MKLINWAPEVISEDGLWIKKDAATNRVAGLYILILFLNIMMWVAIFFK